MTQHLPAGHCVPSSKTEGQGAVGLLASLSLQDASKQSPAASPEPRKSSSETRDSVTQDCSGSNPMTEDEDGSRQLMDISRQPANAMSPGRLSDNDADRDAIGRRRHRRKSQPSRAPESIERPSTPIFSFSSTPSPAELQPKQAPHAPAGEIFNYQLRSRNSSKDEVKPEQPAASSDAALQPGKGQKSRLAVLQPPGGRDEPYMCPSCGTLQTPMWRWVNEKLFCNACALRLKRDIKLAAIASKGGRQHSKAKHAGKEVPLKTYEQMETSRREATPGLQRPATLRRSRRRRQRSQQDDNDSSDSPPTKIPRSARSMRWKTPEAMPDAAAWLQSGGASQTEAFELNGQENGDSPDDSSSPASNEPTSAWNRDPRQVRQRQARHIIVRTPAFPKRPLYEAQGEYAALGSSAPAPTSSPTTIKPLFSTSPASPFAWPESPYQVPIRPGQLPTTLGLGSLGNFLAQPISFHQAVSFQRLPVCQPQPVLSDNLAAAADRLLADPETNSGGRAQIFGNGLRSMSFRALLSAPSPGDAGPAADSALTSVPSSLLWQSHAVGDRSTPANAEAFTLTKAADPAACHPLATTQLTSFSMAPSNHVSPDLNCFSEVVAITDALPSGSSPWEGLHWAGVSELQTLHAISHSIQSTGGPVGQRGGQEVANGWGSHAALASQGSWEVRNALGESQPLRSRRIDGAGVRWGVRRRRSGSLS